MGKSWKLFANFEEKRNKSPNMEKWWKNWQIMKRKTENCFNFI